MHGGGTYSNCTEDVLVENILIHLGVGASVGSVPPNPRVSARNCRFWRPHAAWQVNCIRLVKFTNIVFDHPIKAIYIKPNPGTVLH